MEIKVPENNSILIVDDVFQNITLLGSILKNAGYQVEFALNGNEALDWVQHHSFDMIILDVMMPGMDGFNLCSLLKQNTETSEIPIIFLTAKDNKSDIIKGLEHGAVDYVTKPFNSTELLKRVETHIQFHISKKQLINLNQELELKNKQVSDSINYACRIQEAVLPLKENIDSILPEHFVFFKPRDIVSGDFYWIKQIEDKAIVMLGDCTGHGIPGAFMSMLGISFLNEITSEYIEYNPAHIITELNNKLVKTLHQNKQKSIRDGIELSICLIDYSKNTICISSSGIYTFIVRRKTNDKNLGAEIKRYSNDENTYEVLFIKGKSFHVHCSGNYGPSQICSIPLNHDDIVILTSDGIFDQKGGNKGRKYGRKQFVDLLLKNNKLPLNDLNRTIANSMEAWMQQGFEQIDDITVIGFKTNKSFGQVDLF